MNIDIRTLSIVLSITSILQIAVILMQYLVNKTYKGIGWWLTGYILIAVGFALIPLREFAPLEKLSIILSNVFQLSGSLALYIGINIFFDRKIKSFFLSLASVIYFVLIAYFTYAEYSLPARTIIYSFTTSITSFLIAYTLFVHKSRPITGSANFISAVFFMQGSLLLFRGVVNIIQPSTESFFTPTLIQVVLFLVSLVNINLWMSGFIIMINQRLNEDNFETKEHFELIFNTSPDAALISRLDDGNIINANESFMLLSGFKRKETIGRSTSDLGVWAIPSDLDKIREELFKKGICENREISFKNADGRIFSLLISSKVITLNGIPHVISVARDITVRKKIEDKLIQAIDEVIKQRENAEQANREKELLLREVHHRIKNNMNTIIGLLTIQSDTVKEPSAAAALHDAGSRVRSMMMLYDKLYRSEGFIEISIREYLSPLVDEIAGSFHDRRTVRIEKSIADFMINAETLFSLGIIVNELITNMMKYAFTGIESKVMTVSAVMNNNHACISIGDNGKGLPEHIDLDNSTGFGLQLVGMLTKQIGGSMKIERHNGTEFILEFDL
ncbi:MAG TPA: histidine kinase dimerization/phosphoacceptor domain -containing protein [Spirochaetota bacterium]|nr:histidine kinase dimerization/phosphoacceptor domain -containing protein [Spirochaetota bacterium]